MKKKTIALRLLDKSTRQSFTLQLPDLMLYGIKEISRLENKSMSWVIEQNLKDLYGFPVEYKQKVKK